MDIIERLPPSMIQLLVVLAPAIAVLHRLVLLVTWRGGYRARVQSWILLLSYVLLCMYGYEVLRYAPQAPILMLLGVAWMRRSFSRVTGQRRAADERGSVQALRTAAVQLAEIADFVCVLYDGLLAPLVDVATWKVAGFGPVHFITLLIVSWPLWLLCMLPPDMWLTPFVYVSTTWHAVLASAPVAAVRAYYAAHVAPAIAEHFAQNAPSLVYVHGVVSRAWSAYVAPHLGCLGAPSLAWQVWPPWPIASLTLRHVLLVVGVVALTWCSPWASLLRAALWRSAYVRRAVLGTVRVLSGSDTLASAISPLRTKPEKGAPTLVRETEFVFEIYENQRWWIGLDWTAALLPQERPSWSDSECQAVAPPASFSLPAASRVATPSSRTPGHDDVRTAVWRWVDSEWHVAGIATITSSSYTPKEEMQASEAQRLSETITAKQDEPVVPPELLHVARPASEPGVSLDVDAEGWQYGDNTWEKLSKQSGMGRYTRRRRWLRKAVLIESVEPGAPRTSS